MTQPATELVERIVREVMSRLGAADGRSGVSPDGSPREDASGASPDARRPQRRTDGEPCAGELAISSRVVSIAEVEDRLQGIRRLVVPPGAVVTPSVRDELRRRNIAVVRGRTEGPCRGDAAEVLMMVLGSRFDPAALEGALADEGLAARTERADCLVAATDTLARRLAQPQSLALLVSAYPAVAVCLANRHAGVRAVWGVDSGRLAGDAASVGANALVLDPRSTSTFQLRQMAVQFCRQGPLNCPKELQDRLG